MLALLAASGASVGQAQTAAMAGGNTSSQQATLEQSLEAYRQAMLGRDAEALAGFAYPTFYQLVPRDKLAARLRETYDSDIAPRVTAFAIGDISPEATYSAGIVRWVKIAVALQLTRPGDATPQIDELITGRLRQSMGPEAEIDIDEDKGVINVRKDTQLVAINEGKSGWKFIERKKLQMLILSGLLPDDLLNLLR